MDDKKADEKSNESWAGFFDKLEKREKRPTWEECYKEGFKAGANWGALQAKFFQSSDPS